MESSFLIEILLFGFFLEIGIQKHIIKCPREFVMMIFVKVCGIVIAT